MSERTLLNILLIDGVDDWINVSWIYSRVSAVVGQDRQLRRSAAIGSIAEILFRGLAVAGDVDNDGFHAWDASPAESLVRITSLWFENWLDEIPTPGAIAWFSNTSAGDAQAQLALGVHER